MGKKKNWLIAAVCVLLFGLATLGYTLVCVAGDDHTAPVIMLETDTLELSVTAGNEVLLQGVTARDNRDGDVTASIVVEGVSNITDAHTATITYAAFDSSGNVSKTTRTLHYTDYTAPRFGLSRALVFSAGTSSNVLDCVTARDVVDGDISRQVKGTLVSDTGGLIQPGVHTVDFRVTNSMGQTVHIALPVDIYAAGSYNAALELTDYLVYVPKGASFNPEAYPAALTVGMTEYSLLGWKLKDNITVTMNSSVNTAEPGVYSVAYTVTVDDRYTGYSRLHVVVEE